MTDKEIIKALECCRNGLCTECPRLNTPAHILLCKEQLICEALDLINRQNAEIEQLKIENRILSQKRISFPERLEIDRKARAEAVKEFLRKQEIELANNTDISAVGYQSVIELNIKILKEMGIE